MLKQAALAFLGYIQDNPQGFRVLLRDSPVTGTAGTLAPGLATIQEAKKSSKS